MRGESAASRNLRTQFCLIGIIVKILLQPIDAFLPLIITPVTSDRIAYHAEPQHGEIEFGNTSRDQFQQVHFS